MMHKLFIKIHDRYTQSEGLRNLVKNPQQRNELLGSAFYMKLSAGITTVILAITAVYFIKQGDKLTLYLVALSGTKFIFQTAYVIDFYLI
jgi:PST family polysaccharide transporter